MSDEFDLVLDLLEDVKRKEFREEEWLRWEKFRSETDLNDQLEGERVSYKGYVANILENLENNKVKLQLAFTDEVVEGGAILEIIGFEEHLEDAPELPPELTLLPPQEIEDDDVLLRIDVDKEAIRFLINFVEQEEDTEIDATLEEVAETLAESHNHIASELMSTMAFRINAKYTLTTDDLMSELEQGLEEFTKGRKDSLGDLI